jgi:Zn finger protein HypA/HybF involved in hydrogenase expression
MFESEQNFQCQRCTRITTLMAGESEEEAFPPHYTCPTCGSGREMIIRKS